MQLEPAIKIELVISMSMDGTDDVTEIAKLHLADFLQLFDVIQRIPEGDYSVNPELLAHPETLLRKR